MHPVSAPMSLRISQPIAVCNISGWWKDPRHPDTFHARAVAPHSCLNDSATCTFAVDMSSAGLGTPFGNYNATTTNQTLWLQFASGTRSTGQLATTACNLLVWTDAPDRKAGNTWCRVASSAGGACIAAVGPSLLSSPRRMLAAASVGKYSLFAGGFDVSNVASAAVDIFVNGSRIATHTLSQPRGLLAATALSERYVLFAGGQDASGNKSDVVDIFDALTLTWSVAKLSLPRSMLAATSAGEIALFAGGELSEHEGNTSTADDTDRVDLYDSRDGTWSTASLSIARKKLAATSLDDVALFAGGYLSAAGPRAEWDAYDAVSGAWSRGNLSAPRMRLQAASAGGAALFIGGMGDGTTQGCGADCNVVDLCPLWSKGLRKWSVQHLQRGRYEFAAVSLRDSVIVVTGGKQGPLNASQPGDHAWDLVEVYHTSNASWTQRTIAQEARSYIVAVRHTMENGEEVVLVGGGDFQNGTRTDMVDIIRA